MDIKKEITRSEIISHICKNKAHVSSFHWHENVELCQPINKPARFLVDSKMIEADVGDIVVVKEQAVHVFMVDYDDTDIRVSQFPLKILMHLDTPIKPLKTHITAKEMKEIPDLYETVNKLLVLLDNEKQAEKAADNPYMQFLAVTLYMLLMRHFADETDYASSKKDRKDFYKLTGYVNEHFKEGINIKTISAQLYIPKTRITKVFEKYTGMGLNDYINSIRIKNANRLMIEGQSITEAALESGFQSVRTFNYVYKEQMGMTPTEYIKKTMNQKRPKI